MLQVLLDACVTTPLILYDHVMQSYVLDGDTESLIRDVHVIIDIIFVWTVWNKADDDVWLLGFKAIEFLIRKAHHQRDFNISVLLTAGAVEKLFNICLVRIFMMPLCIVFIMPSCMAFK